LLPLSFPKSEPFIFEPPFAGADIAGLNPRSKVACRAPHRADEANSRGSNLARATRREANGEGRIAGMRLDYRKTQHQSSLMLSTRQLSCRLAACRRI
jgi:hypothetical protein